MKIFLHPALSAFIFCFGAACCHTAVEKNSADCVLRNAHVITVNSNQSSAEAVAVRGDGIIFVGKKQRG